MSTGRQSYRTAHGSRFTAARTGNDAADRNFATIASLLGDLLESPLLQGRIVDITPSVHSQTLTLSHGLGRIADRWLVVSRTEPAVGEEMWLEGADKASTRIAYRGIPDNKLSILVF